MNSSKLHCFGLWAIDPIDFTQTPSTYPIIFQSSETGELFQRIGGGVLIHQGESAEEFLKPQRQLHPVPWQNTLLPHWPEKAREESVTLIGEMEKLHLDELKIVALNTNAELAEILEWYGKAEKDTDKSAHLKDLNGVSGAALYINEKIRLALADVIKEVARAQALSHILASAKIATTERYIQWSLNANILENYRI